VLANGGNAIAQAPESAVEKQLDDVARIATVMVDGDVCRRIVTRARSMP